MSHKVYGEYGEAPVGFNVTGNDTWLNNTPIVREAIEVPSGTNAIQIFRTVCELGLAFPLAIFGIVGNILALVVLARHKNRQTTIVLLQALAVADTLVLVCGIALRSIRFLYPAAMYNEIYQHFYRWLYPSVYFVRLTDTWLTVLLTVDRFIAVCIPLKATRLCTLGRTYILMILVLFLSAIFSLPRFFEVTMTSATHPTLNYTRSFFHMTPLTENVSYNIGYRILLYFLVMYVVPMILLVVLNTALLVALRKANNQRSTLQLSAQLSNNSRNNRSVTIIVVTVVLVCIVCNITAMVGHILWSIPLAFKEQGPKVDIYRRYISNMSNVMVTLNSAINFIIYCLCSRNFRCVLVNTFHCEQVCDTPGSGGKPEKVVLLNRNSSSGTQSTIVRNSLRTDSTKSVPLKYVSKYRAANGSAGKESLTDTSGVNL